MSYNFSYPLNNYEFNLIIKLIKQNNYYLFCTQIEERIGCQYGYLTRFTKIYNKNVSEPITIELIELFKNPTSYKTKRQSFKKRLPKVKIQTTENTTSSRDLLKKLRS